MIFTTSFEQAYATEFEESFFAIFSPPAKLIQSRRIKEVEKIKDLISWCCLVHNVHDCSKCQIVQLSTLPCIEIKEFLRNLKVGLLTLFPTPVITRDSI